MSGLSSYHKQQNCCNFSWHCRIRTKHIMLFIDGFIVKIQRPDGAGDAYFCGKSCDSINVQYVTDKNGRIHTSSLDCLAVHTTKPQHHGLPSYDSFWTTCWQTTWSLVIQPIAVCIPRSSQDIKVSREFSDACTRMRQIVERSIGASQLKWRLQQLKENRIAAKKRRLICCKMHNRFSHTAQPIHQFSSGLLISDSRAYTQKLHSTQHRLT